MCYLSLILIILHKYFFILWSIAVKTPVCGLNSLFLKAHTEAPLSGSIILAAIVLNLVYMES